MMSSQYQTEFYKEFEKLRLPDPGGKKSGFESDRQMAKRLGIHNKTITLYKRGAIPHPQTIAEMVKLGGYNQETFYRLLSAAAGRTRATSDRTISVYRASDVELEGIVESAEPIFHVTCPPELSTVVNQANLVGIKLDENDVSCEPKISSGSVVVYSSEPCDEPEEGIFYVFRSKGGIRPASVRVRGKEIWIANDSPKKYEKISKKDFQETALGRIIFATKFFVKF